MRIILIRHGSTPSNLRKSYLGITDESLSEPGFREVASLAEATVLPAPDFLVISPMLRCRQTAAILFPNIAGEICGGLRECDFGIFEGKTAAELENNPDYSAWVSSGCTTDIPGGESVSEFGKRCVNSFLSSLEKLDKSAAVAFVIHGGCIMAILEALALPKKKFYEYHIKNCEFVIYEFTDGVLLPE